MMKYICQDLIQNNKIAGSSVRRGRGGVTKRDQQKSILCRLLIIHTPVFTMSVIL